MEKSPKQFPIRQKKFEPKPRCICGELKTSHDDITGTCNICECPKYDELGVLTLREYCDMQERSSTQ